MRSSSFLLSLTIVCCGFVLASCSLPRAGTPQPIVEAPTVIEAPAESVEPTPPPAPSPSYPTRIRVSTTSDWTVVRLTSGGTLHEMHVTSSSQEALSAGLDGTTISLSQSIGRAQGGESVEIVVEARLAGLDPATPLTLEIERGHIGTTRVDIFSYYREPATIVASFTWDGIQPGGKNAQTYEVSPQSFLGTASAANEYIVIAQLNFWYYGAGFWGGFENENHERNTPLTRSWARPITPATRPSSTSRSSGRLNTASTLSRSSGLRHAALVEEMTWRRRWMMSF